MLSLINCKYVDIAHQFYLILHQFKGSVKYS